MKTVAEERNILKEIEKQIGRMIPQTVDMLLPLNGGDFQAYEPVKLIGILQVI